MRIRRRAVNTKNATCGNQNHIHVIPRLTKLKTSGKSDGVVGLFVCCSHIRDNDHEMAHTFETGRSAAYTSLECILEGEELSTLNRIRTDNIFK